MPSRTMLFAALLMCALLLPVVPALAGPDDDAKGGAAVAEPPKKGAPAVDSSEPNLTKLRASVVKVFTVSQPEDYRRPWQRPRPQGSSGSAFYIGKRMLMTNAHVVSDAKNLQVKRADRVKRYEARVLFAGHQSDLAVITVDDNEFWEGMVPLEISERPAMRSKVMTIGYPTGGNKLSVTEGVVSRIEVNTYVHTGAHDHLTIQTDAAINPGNSGGPVIQNGKVCGVAFQGRMFAQNLGYMIAPSVIQHFLTDIRDDIYHGYAELGIYTANLRNQTLRKFLGVPKDQEGGVLVLKPMPYASTVGKLKKNDVILKIDGVKVEADGTVKVGEEFLDFGFVIESKQIGEKAVLTVLRDGKVIDVEITLKDWEARMKPGRVYDERPEYMVLGGYLFLPLTNNYLGWGRSNELSYYMQQYYRTVAKEGKTREQLVLLSRVLAHPSTRYIRYSDAIVDKVDGVQPKDFAHFVQLIDSSKKDLVKIEFEGVNTAPLILDMKKIREVNPEILKKYEIAEDRYIAPKEDK
ncbi:MAG: trypsin-like peptidase domain-containing protein [Planctomycetota bacterium]|nr:trypsin-like peptidase domain-containing protein [Planctomycetota bacterium]